MRGKLTKFNISRFRQGAPECNCADPFSISCPVHNKDLSDSGPRSRAKEEIKEKVGEEEAQRMLKGHMTEREEVIQESGKKDLFNQNNSEFLSKLKVLVYGCYFFKKCYKIVLQR